MMLFACPLHNRILTHDVAANVWRCPLEGCEVQVADEDIAKVWASGR
jgi:hypothetical protein